MAIVDGLRWLSYLLSSLVYELITWMYNIFIRLCNSRILDSEVLESISERIGLLLGILMLFLVITSCIQMLLEPDKLTDKEKGIGNIVKKIILVVVMLGTHSAVFNTLYDAQRLLIESDIIGKFLLPYEIKKDEFGGALSSSLFGSFYHFNETIDANDNVDCWYKAEQLKDDIQSDNDFSIGSDCLNEKVKVTKDGETKETYVMNFNLLLAPLVGLGAVYFIFYYCISVGIRSIQLAFLEIISPAAIISYLSPKKDTMFSKWFKLYSTTYIDVFIRIMIINLSIFLIATVLDANGSWIFWDTVGKKGDFSDTLIMVLIIMALLMFAKKAPELLKDLLPSSAKGLGFGIKSPKKMFDDMLGGNLVKGAAKVATAGTAIGLTGAITSGISRYKINKKNGKDTGQALLGAAGGVFGGFGRGLVAGAQKGSIYSNFSKGIKNQRGIDDKYDELITSGGTTIGKYMSGLTSHFGETMGQTFTRHFNNYDKLENFEKDMKKQADEISFVKNAKANYDALIRYEGEDDDAFQRRRNKAFAKYKALQNAAIEGALTGATPGTTTYEYEHEVEFTYIDSNGKEQHDTRIERTTESLAYNFDGDSDDRMYASDIESSFAQSKDYIGSHSIELYDENTGSYFNVNSENVGTFKDLKNINKGAHKTKTHVMKTGDYSKAMANDKAAGVNSNGSGKK